MALLPGSQAVNAGTTAAAGTLDQRGLPRAAAGVADIGAFEAQIAAPRVVSFQVLYGNDRSYELIGSTRVKLPWAVTGVRVVFDQPVTGTAASLAGFAVGSFAGSGTATLTWTLAAPLLTAAVAGQLQGAGANTVRSAWGLALDGAATGGAGGTAYSRSVRVLAGDFDDDGVVTLGDALKVRALIGVSNPFADVNGDGVVSAADFDFIRQRVGNRLV